LFGHYNINDLSAFSYLSTTHLSDEPSIFALGDHSDYCSISLFS